MSLQLVIAQGSGPSGNVLSALLRERGVPLHSGSNWSQPPKARVSWGSHLELGGTTTLNARVRGDKLAELKAFAQCGVPCPVVKEELTEADFAERPLWLARKLAHKGGTDLRPVTQPDEAAWRKTAGWAYFTAREPIKREIRTWVFRGKHLATYEKKMLRPEEYTGLGRNHKYGFGFSRLLDDCETAVTSHAVCDQALTALGLDFGAVDVIQRPDNSLCVLEVNTAPGIENERRISGQRLADCIAQWYRSL